MAVHLTAAETRALFGLGAPKRTTRRTARGPYASECYDCGEAFTTQAAETRHVNATGHARYQLCLTPAVYGPVMSDTPPIPDPVDPDVPIVPDPDDDDDE